VSHAVSDEVFDEYEEYADCLVCVEMLKKNNNNIEANRPHITRLMIWMKKDGQMKRFREENVKKMEKNGEANTRLAEMSLRSRTADTFFHTVRSASLQMKVFSFRRLVSTRFLISRSGNGPTVSLLFSSK